MQWFIQLYHVRYVAKNLLTLFVVQGELQQEELFVAVEMLSAVALINQAVEARDVGAFCATLVSSAAGLADIDDSLIQRRVE